MPTISNNIFHFICFSIILYLPNVIALNNGLALKPPMGWMSWGYFMCNISCHLNDYGSEKCINENLIKQTIDLLVKNGYQKSGYEYVIIDDCWAEIERERVYDIKTGRYVNRLVADRKRFPNGIKHLTDYAHAKNMKLGIYIDFGRKSCTEFNPGSINDLETDARTFAEWEIDYVKVDGCFSEPMDMDIGYPLFGHFLNKTNRPMVYSCSWPYYQRYIGIEPDYRYIAKHCNLWRNYWDIRDQWNLIREIITYYAYKQDVLIPNAKPGAWNDPDQLMVGTPGLSFEEAKAHMAIWAILAAPLIMSNDIAKVPERIRKEILQNSEIIVVNQDVLGIQGRMLYQQDLVQVWLRPIAPLGTKYAVAFLYAFPDDTFFSINGHNIGGNIVKSNGLLDSESTSPEISASIKKHSFTFHFSALGIESDHKQHFLFKDLYDHNNQWVMLPHENKTIKIAKPGVKFYMVLKS